MGYSRFRTEKDRKGLNNTPIFSLPLGKSETPKIQQKSGRKDFAAF